MAENKSSSSKSLLIFVIVLFALIAALCINIYIYYPALKNYPPVVQPTVEPTSNIDISDWKTYRNEDIGIEFKYPKVLGSTEEVYTDNIDKNLNDLARGKKVIINFKKNNEYGWFNFTAYSSNYQSEKEFLIFNGVKDVNTECLKPLQYGGQGDVCKFIEFAGEKAVWQNFFIEDECAMTFGSQIYFNNKSASVYKGLRMIFHIEDVETKIKKLYDCSDGGKAYLEAVVQSKNIMERKNLSENDLQRLNIVDRVLSSFKFIK